MLRSKRLTEKEIGEIEALCKRLFDYIRRLKWSRHIIQNYLKGSNAYGKKYSSGRKSKLFKQDERTIVRKASNSTKFSHKLEVNSN